MGVVGGDVAGLVMRPQLHQGAVDRLQVGHVVLLELEEEVVLAEQVVIPVQAPAGGLDLALADQARHFGRHAAGGADQPFGVFGQEILVDARIIIEAFQLGRRGDLEQVLVTGLVLGQQQQVGGAPVLLGVMFLHRAGRQVGFQPDDGLDAGLLGGVVELDHAEHGAVVGDGQGRHVHLLGALDQLLDVREAIQQGVFGVDVQVGEGHGSQVNVKFSQHERMNWGTRMREKGGNGCTAIIARLSGLKILESRQQQAGANPPAAVCSWLPIDKSLYGLQFPSGCTTAVVRARWSPRLAPLRRTGPRRP